MEKSLSINAIPSDIVERMSEIVDVPTVRKELSFAVQIYNNPKNEYLRRCSMPSLYSAILNVVQVGLTLNPASKEAYIIPRWESKTSSVVAVLEPSYIGLQKLVLNTGTVKNIQTNLVYANDVFDVSLGLKTEIKHKPYYVLGKESGSIVGVYSVAKLTTGDIQYEYMPINKINEIRDTSESYKAFKSGKVKSAIWDTWEDEMTRKTCIKRMCKYLPKASENMHLTNAIELDNDQYGIQNWQINKIESMLSTSILLDSQQEDIIKELAIMTSDAAYKCIEYLENHQKSPIESGDNYGAKYIQDQLKKQGC